VFKSFKSKESEALSMLKKSDWTSFADYKFTLIHNLKKSLFLFEGKFLKNLNVVAKLYILNTDVLYEIIAPLYPNEGRPAKLQPEIFRSFLLMSSLGIHSIDEWIKTLKAEPFYAFLIGTTPDNIPELGNHYDFINRLWAEPPQKLFDDRNSLRNPYCKPDKPKGKNQKAAPRRPGVVARLVDFLASGKSFKRTPDRVLKKIFDKMALIPSMNAGFILDAGSFSVSGDGTSIITGASSYGTKACDCKSKGIYNCSCKRKFSDPDARWGWDSYHERYFFGYHAYILSSYNKGLALDLPLYFSLNQGSRHDSAALIFALNDFNKSLPLASIDNLILDSAHDNYPTYNFLSRHSINAIIALNKTPRGNKIYDSLAVNPQGIPICKNNCKMTFGGNCKGRHRLKWRCPLATSSVTACEYKASCSSSAYGRTFYTKPDDDPRLFTIVPRGSQKWKDLFKRRSSAERVNTRLLNDYELERHASLSKKVWSLWTMIHSINIHLDAHVKYKSINSNFIKNLVLEDYIGIPT
jgi:hypothetical protein